MAETKPKGQKPEGRKPSRIRAGRNRRERHNLVSFHGHGLLALIIFAILSLSVLGVGLAVASLTIFSVGRGGHITVPTSVENSPTPSASSISELVGKQINGTLVGVWVDKNLVVIQPQGGQPVQALVTAKSSITRGGVPTPVSELISGDAVVVTFVAGPKSVLEVGTLNDVETVPTNTPPPTATPARTANPIPAPTALPTLIPGPTSNPGH